MENPGHGSECLPNLALGKWRQADPWGSPVSQLRLIGEPQVPERGLVSKKKKINNKKQETAKVDLDYNISVHTRVSPYMYAHSMNMHTHAGAQNNC